MIQRVFVIFIVFAIAGCATKPSDGQLTSMGDSALLEVAQTRVLGAYYGEYRSAEALRAIAIYCDRQGASVETKNAILAGRYWKGMTATMALLSQGKPESINRDSVGSNESEQWVYRNALHGGQLYLYFRGGILTSWQTRE